MEAVQQSIVEEFELFDTWADKYQFIIELGAKMPAFPDSEKTDHNFVKGCQSQVWFSSAWHDNLIQLQGMSDSSIVHGLIAILIRIFNHKTAEQILATELDCLTAIGLSKHLSSQRNNGLSAMLEHIRSQAKEHL